jgi:hypothetical protein
MLRARPSSTPLAMKPNMAAVWLGGLLLLPEGPPWVSVAGCPQGVVFYGLKKIIEQRHHMRAHDKLCFTAGGTVNRPNFQRSARSPAFAEQQGTNCQEPHGLKPRSSNEGVGSFGCPLSLLPSVQVDHRTGRDRLKPGGCKPWGASGAARAAYHAAPQPWPPVRYFASRARNDRETARRRRQAVTLASTPPPGLPNAGIILCRPADPRYGLRVQATEIFELVLCHRLCGQYGQAPVNPEKPRNFNT